MCWIQILSHLSVAYESPWHHVLAKVHTPITFQSKYIFDIIIDFYHVLHFEQFTWVHFVC